MPDARATEGVVGDEFNFQSIETAVLFDRSARPHRFSQFHASKTAIFVFLRNFLDYTAVEYAEDLAKVPNETLDAKGVVIVPVGCGQCRHVEEFENLTGLKRVYTDPERVLYTNLRLLTAVDHWADGAKASSVHVRSSLVMGVVRGSLRAMKSMELHGDPNQQGASVIISPGRVVRHFHRDRCPFDHTPINDLLACCGVPPVQFDSKHRVFNV